MPFWSFVLGLYINFKPLPLLFAGPGAHNVIPDSVELKGTIRALTLNKFDHLRDRVSEVCILVLAYMGQLQYKAEKDGCNTNIYMETSYIKVSEVCVLTLRYVWQLKDKLSKRIH